MMINDPAGIEWLYTGLTTDDEQEIVGLSKSDYETARAALESDTRRAERAEAEAQKTERARLYYQERVAELEAEAVEYRAQLIKAKAEAAQLRADLDAARGVETAEQPPEVGQRVQIIITADFVHGGFEPVADNRLFLPRHMAPFWRPLWAGTQRGYEVHVMTGSTSAGRRQRDAGKE